MAAPIRHRIELDAVRELHLSEQRKVLEVALHPLPNCILAIFPASLLGVGVFTKELFKLYRRSRDDPRAHKSPRECRAALRRKKKPQIIYV